jgi:hypothetical protein
MLTLSKPTPKLRARSEVREVLVHLAYEAAVLLPLVVIYFLVVMHAMGDFLTQLHKEDLRVYAAVSVALLVGQSIVLDGVAGRILAFLGLQRV